MCLILSTIPFVYGMTTCPTVDLLPEVFGRLIVALVVVVVCLTVVVPCMCGWSLVLSKLF